MSRMRESLAVTLAALAACALLRAPAYAADASAWVEDMNSALRLIAGSGKNDEGSLRAGVEIKLKPGWHTYWRYPGDSGVPPRFSYSGSDNLGAVKILYPAPRAISDETGTSIGYTDHVIFPLRVMPRQKGKPVTLHLKAEYAVCEKLCVPVEATTELTLAAGDASTDGAIAAADSRVPKQEDAAAAGLKAHRVAATPKPQVLVDLATPPDQPVQIFVEGPTPDWALPIPKPVQGAPAGHQYFSFELDGLPPGVNAKSPFDLTFTIVRGDKPIEVKSRLD
jgi:DsbC/DsbD-like thiol-disulfide interchange protein